MKSRSTAISASLTFMLGTILLAGCSEKEPGLQADNTAKASPQASIPADEPVAKVASRVGPSVVQVNVRAVRETPLGTQRGEGLGSGVIYRRDGYIVTNNHVIEGATGVNVKGKVTTPYLGVLTTDLSPEDAGRFDLPVDSGALVDQVVPGSPAREAGVRKGDIITALGDARIVGYGDLLGALRDHEPGDRVTLTIFRNTEEMKLVVTLGEMSQ